MRNRQERIEWLAKNWDKKDILGAIRSYVAITQEADNNQDTKRFTRALGIIGELQEALAVQSNLFSANKV